MVQVDAAPRCRREQYKKSGRAAVGINGTAEAYQERHKKSFSA